MKRTALILIASVFATAAAAQTTTNTQSFWDRDGHFSGSSSSHQNETAFSDRNGHFAGSAIRNSNGTTSMYDKNGHFTGSVVNTSPSGPQGDRYRH